MPNHKFFAPLLAAALLLASTGLHAQESKSADTESKVEKLKRAFEKFYLRGYGVVNYYHFDWDTDPDKRDAIDAERLNLYLGYHFTDNIELKTEIEFEHGGTGATMEFDRFEEFGEFEQEIEAGGEVILEQLNLYFKVKPYFNIRVGKFRLYMGIASTMDDATEYLTTYRTEIENTILPLGWYEHGLEFSGKFANDKLSYKLYLVNGLDASGFSSRNWVNRGYQKRFEMVNAENFAVVGRLDYHFMEKSTFGASAYFGNSKDNRPKPDLDVNAFVGVYDLHLILEEHPYRARAYFMYGTLSNSEEVSRVNQNLSNNLNVKRTPVGAAAAGGLVEVAYDIFHPIKKIKKHQLFLFGHYEYFDSMFKTQGEIFNNPRWERSILTGGLNYYPHPQIVFKALYSSKTLGTNEVENTFSAGLGFEF